MTWSLRASFERALVVAALAFAAPLLAGCSSGMSFRTRKMRTALDAADPRRALDALNHELHVKRDDALPARLRGDDALLVLDRATIQQSIAALANSQRDYDVAYHALDVLDLAHGTSDEIARWLFSASAGRYAAPVHEKVLLDALDLVTYLEAGDLSGARVEARRLAVTQRTLRDRGGPRAADDLPALAFGALLAGFAFEKSGDLDEAARWYADAASVYPRLAPATGDARDAPDARDGSGEILLVVGWGRVPHRIAEHVPIGAAIERASGALSAEDRAAAKRAAHDGLLAWVHYPTLAPDTPLDGPDGAPRVVVDGASVGLDAVLDVTAEVRAAWKRIEPVIMAAATTRAVARVAAGHAIEGATSASKDKDVRAVGALTSLLLQIALNAADVPDTRSWETLPARLGLARVRVPAGAHRVALDARGWHREGTLAVAAGGYAALSVFGLR
jgi:hypothetical protein